MVGRDSVFGASAVLDAVVALAVTHARSVRPRKLAADPGIFGAFLAQMIGVQRNAVSMGARALQQAGVISYSRGHIEIKNADGLNLLRVL